jgi:Peptidoglycan-synthase activator LpoB/EF hand
LVPKQGTGLRRLYVNRCILFAFIAVLAASCVATPRGRPAQNGVFKPDPARVRSALGIVAGVNAIEETLSDSKALDRAAQAVWVLCRDVHPTRNDLDLVFDRNGNGRIDPYEIQSARIFFFGSSLLSLNIIDPVLASKLAAPPRNSMTQEDLRVWDEYLFIDSKRLLKPHALSNPFEKKLAEGDDRNFDEKAIRNAIGMATRGAVEAFLQAAPFPASKPSSIVRGPVKTKLQEYANTSGSGTLSDAEARAAEDALKVPHAAKSVFDWAIDFEGTGYVSQADIDEARRAAFLPASRGLPAAVGPYPVETKADSLLDLNGDGIVTDDELAAVAKALAVGGGAPLVPPKLLAAFDGDGNGMLDAKEIMRALEFFRPHPVDPTNALDLALDTQGRRFLTPDEIGIGAGRTSKGPVINLDERVRAFRFAAQKQSPKNQQAQLPKQANAAQPSASSQPSAPQIVQKRLDIAGKKLAVMGLTSATKNVDQEALDGTVTFLENAFVNVGSVSIVDRSDIDKVMKELELQASGALADEGTAVKAGKLSGAEIIATGTISLVGKKYYLNTKLISVETGEVLGSSIASADSPDGFLAMCQEAAVKLF